MREIKFRGKRISNGEWVYGYFFKTWERCFILLGTTNGIPDMVVVTPETVGQYTGLKDKKGVEIFEGDVLDFDEIEWGGKISPTFIEWYNYKAGWNPKIGTIEDVKNHRQVIGNIHEQEAK